LDDDEKGVYSIDTPGGKQDVSIVSESGMYGLVMSSRKPEAKKFKRWVRDVLVQLRREGKVELTPGADRFPMFSLYHERKEKNKVLDLPENYWCVWRESMNFMLDFEKAVNRLGVQIAFSEYDLLDGSIGSCWANYREGKPWAGAVKKYIHDFRDKRGKQEANCYHRDEFWHFRDWLEGIYASDKMPSYLKRKYGRTSDLVLRADDIIGLLPEM